MTHKGRDGWTPPPVPQHRRGAIVLRAAPKSARRRAAITLAGIPVDPKDETKHFKLIGAPGTGKSTAIREMLTAAPPIRRRISQQNRCARHEAAHGLSEKTTGATCQPQMCSSYY